MLVYAFVSSVGIILLWTHTHTHTVILSGFVSAQLMATEEKDRFLLRQHSSFILSLPLYLPLNMLSSAWYLSSLSAIVLNLPLPPPLRFPPAPSQCAHFSLLASLL